MGITIQRSGPMTTVQDLGRIGYQDQGFSASGAMDQRALRLANLLVDNDPDSAVLEITIVGPQFTFDEANCFAVTGADLHATLNGTPLETNRAYAAKAGDVVAFPQSFPKAGARAYVAFAGGLDVPPLMGSRSTYLKGRMGGLEGRALKTGDALSFLAPRATLPNLEQRTVPEDFAAVYGGKQVTLRVVMGPQESAFTPAGVETFLTQPYQVTPNSDRMGSRLDGPVIEHAGRADIISDGIALGAVQVPKEGKPIILLADRQSTGGYTKIANVISVDLPKVAQRQIGDELRFQPVTVQEAQRLLAEDRAALESLSQRWKTPEKVPSFWARLFGKR